MCRGLQPEWPKGCYRLATARLACGLFEDAEDAAVAAFEGIKLLERTTTEHGPTAVAVNSATISLSKELRKLTKEAVKRGQEEHRKQSSANTVNGRHE